MTIELEHALVTSMSPELVVKRLQVEAEGDAVRALGAVLVAARAGELARQSKDELPGSEEVVTGLEKALVQAEKEHKAAQAELANLRKELKAEHAKGYNKDSKRQVLLQRAVDEQQKVCNFQTGAQCNRLTNELKTARNRVRTLTRLANELSAYSADGADVLAVLASALK